MMASVDVQHTSPADPCLLEVKALSKTYGETQALDDVSIRFGRGTVHAILGENGSGKSTLVKLLSGIVSPSLGQIHVAGTPLRGFTPAATRAAGIATVFQEVLVAPLRSVTDNILLGCDTPFRRRIPRGQRDHVAGDVLARITETRVDPGAPAGALPLAIRQLIVIARALVHQPRILILDEVTAALDFADRERVFQVLENFASGGGLILFISHRMDEVMRLAQSVSVLRNGRLVATIAREATTPDALLGMMAPAAAKELARAR
jgi:ribose transport system ATP-binding protein